MRKLLRDWLPVVVLAGCALFCRARLDAVERPGGALALADAPTSLNGAFLFGAFKPILVAELWSQCDLYERERRIWELIDAQARLLRLAPDEPAIWSRQASLLAYGIAQSEPDERLRWRWFRRALAIVSAGIERHPGDFDLAELRFRIVFDLIAGDPPCARRLRKGEGGGLLAAAELAGGLRRDFPGRVAAHDDYRTALEESAEFLMNRGRFREARELILEIDRSLFGEPWPFPKEPLRPGLREVLRFGARAMTDLAELADWESSPPRLRDEARLVSLLDDLAGLIGPAGPALLEPGRETFDAALAMLIYIRGMNLCQAELLAKNHGAALRLLRPLNRIATLAEGRDGSELPSYSTAYVETFEKLIGLDEELVAVRTRGEEVAGELADRWRHELEELDRLVVARAGRTDSFARHLLNDRR